eukprot:CAMPEP_0168684422 /NCGR_PEP_ID=MMETSP0503-20121227/28860_1 /TAXON_ID=89963 /ORGANISM="Heterocapsa rotundata, Strain SCCAP K-0483" /LENGTH=65 /DNA_ID=CAMNT_0008729215 /DNA_START=25 /DNA_END=218 /DNA_ORIENTATION=+
MAMTEAPVMDGAWLLATMGFEPKEHKVLKAQTSAAPVQRVCTVPMRPIMPRPDEIPPPQVEDSLA